MGISLAWIGVRGLPYDRVLERLSLIPTERKAPYWDGQPCGKASADGWSLIAAARCDHRIIDPEQLAALSAGCDVIACSVEEHVMFSSAELWSNGVRVWQAMHEQDEGPDHLATEGTLPATFASIVEASLAEQKALGDPDDELDYFEVPLNLAKSYTGFKHDEGSDIPGEDVFQVLDDGAPRSAPWWKFWK